MEEKMYYLWGKPFSQTSQLPTDRQMSENQPVLFEKQEHTL